MTTLTRSVAMALVLSACAEHSESVPGPELDLARSAGPVQVCHLDGKDRTRILTVGPMAAEAHVEHHGDWLVTEEVCGDGIDNDCDGETDEDCCPCFGPTDLEAAFPSGPDACRDVVYEGGFAYILAYNEATPFSQAQVMEGLGWWTGLSCTLYDDASGDDVYLDDLTDFEHDACFDALLDFALDAAECDVVRM